MKRKDEDKTDTALTFNPLENKKKFSFHQFSVSENRGPQRLAYRSLRLLTVPFNYIEL